MENEFTIQDDNDKLVFVIPRRANGLAVILTGLWIPGYLIILLTVIYGQISDNRFIAELNLYMFFFGVVWLIAIKMFLWNVRGKEKITLDSGLLLIERLGTILTIPKKYETNLIDSFGVVKKKLVNLDHLWIFRWTNLIRLLGKIKMLRTDHNKGAGKRNR